MLNSKWIFALIFIVLFCFSANAFSMEKLFYMLRNDSPNSVSDVATGFTSLENHYQDIDIVVPQAYQIDRNGIFWGSLDPRILAFTSQHHIKLMALITNKDFSKGQLHAFLRNSDAQNRALQSILTTCQTNHLYGVQFDFENISVDDKDALSNFYQTAANLLHKNGYVISATIIPILNGPTTSDYQRLRYENWSGAFDYKAIAQSVDFVTLMAYDQHGEGTTPGPVASLPWVEDIVKYAVQQIPADKISLGIPTYSDYWYVGGNPQHTYVAVKLDQISYSTVNDILKKSHAQLHWDSQNKIPYAYFSRDWLNEFIFGEDAASFKALYDLAKSYHLRGISVWRMGTEDPQIWHVLETTPMKKTRKHRKA